MTTTTITNISYTGTTQTASVTSTYGVPVTAHIWGAGGGSCSTVGAPVQLFNTRTAVGSLPTYAYSNGAYCGFLNTYGVWINPVTAANFNVAYSVNFPVAGMYQFEGSCDNYGQVSVDSTAVLSMPGYQASYAAEVYVTAGIHKVTLNGTNTGGPGSIGVTISYNPETGAGGGGGYSRVDFIAKPGDKLLVAVGQGGGAGGVTAPPPAPPVTFNTRETGYSGTVLYPYSPNGSQSTLVNTYGVWNNLTGGGGTVDTTWASVLFPASGYYTIRGSSYGCGFTNEPQGGGTLYIDGTAAISLPGNFGGGTQSVNIYVTAGIHSVRVYVGQASNSRGQRSSVAFVINQTNPGRIPNAPAGLPGASYIALLFNTRFPPPNQAAPVYALGNGDSFLDQWGVWGPDQNDPAFTREYTINVPLTANVIFQMSCNGAAEVRLDGSLILSRTASENPNTTSQNIVNVTAGSHTLTIGATGTVGVLNRVGVTLSSGDQTSYSGGRGGISDPTSAQGFGGGGGGATILSLNGVVIGVGAGGGGGAGSTPNSNNSSSAITDAKFNGQNGQDVFNFNTTDTGGGGGGGGGARGGNGGLGRGSGGGGFSGYNGLSLGTSAAIPPTGRLPYTNEYYPGGDIAGFNFDTATATPTNGSRLPYRNPYTGWQPWMYQHAVCFSANPIEYSVNFPVSGTYIFNMGADYAMTVSVDGTAVASLTDYAGSYSTPSPVEVPVNVTAGTHTISIAWNDDGGTAGFALTIAIPGSVGIAQGGQAGVATNGGNGYVVLEFTTGGGGSIKDSGEWKSIQTVYVKDSGTWKEVQTTFINNGGTWTPIQGGIVPVFGSINSAFGALVRPYSAGSLLAPPPPAPDYSDPGGTYYASGGWD